MPRRTSLKKKFNLENYRHKDHFGEWLGYSVDRVDRKRFTATGSLVLREDHLSPAGRVHGGVISAFFDFACGAAVFSTLAPKDLCSTVELKVNYLRPLFVGDRLRAKARVVFRGKRLCVVQGEILRNRERQPVAIATATFNVIPAG
jgi:uncharacterized protein (TIGR00369 family)